MDLPGTQNRLQHDHIKHSNTGAHHDDGSSEGRPLSDSKLPHTHTSENLSKSASRNSSLFSPHGDQEQDVRPKIITNIEQIQNVEQRQKTRTLKHGLNESKYPSKVEKPHQSQVSFSSSGDAYQHYEAPMSDPDYFNLFNMYDRRDILNGSYQYHKPAIEHSSDDFAKKTTAVPAKTKEKDLSKIRAQSQSIDRDYESTKWPDSQLEVSPLSSPSSPSTVIAVDGDSKLIRPRKHNTVDLKKLSKSSQRQETQSIDLKSKGPRTVLGPHPSADDHLSHKELEISHEHFTKFNISRNKVDNTSGQCTSSLPVRLHTSYTTIASKPHMRKPKSANDLDALRLSFEHRFEPENVKTKVKSVWNSIRYGWTFNSTSNIKYDSPLFMLGKCYHKRKDDPSTEPENLFLRDFVSRIWLTYRSNFYPIPGTKLNTDCGWGCMLRTGQMLVAQCLVTHFLGRDWRLYNKQTDIDLAFYREIIRWFSDPLDTPSDKTPFSLHHLVNFGRAHNKDPGEWYGPSSAAYIFRDAFTKASHSVPILSQLCIYVAQDCTVYIEDAINLCTKRLKSENAVSTSDSDAEASRSNQKVQHEKWQRSLIILIPMRLGGEVTNEIYTPCVQSLLSHDNCMGIIGGRPKHSLYFLGWQDSKLIYLDPHLCREAVDTTIPNFKIETFHCMTPRKLAISKMDPSCAVGFYIRDADEFKKFVREVQEFISPPKQKGIYPLFTFLEGHQYDSTASTASHNHTSGDRRVRVSHYHMDQYGRKTFSGQSEDFVVL